MRLTKDDLIKMTRRLTEYSNWKYSIIPHRSESGGYRRLDLFNNQNPGYEIVGVQLTTREAYEFLRGFYRAYRFLSDNQ